MLWLGNLALRNTRARPHLFSAIKGPLQRSVAKNANREQSLPVELKLAPPSILEISRKWQLLNASASDLGRIHTPSTDNVGPETIDVSGPMFRLIVLSSRRPGVNETDDFTISS